MNVLRKFAAIGAAMMMAFSMMSVGASANSYGVHYTMGAPSSDIELSDDTYTSSVGLVTSVKVHSTSFSSLYPGGYLQAKNVNTNKTKDIDKQGFVYTINTSSLTNPYSMIHNSYTLKNYYASRSISAYGWDEKIY